MSSLTVGKLVISVILFHNACFGLDIRPSSGLHNIHSFKIRQQEHIKGLRHSEKSKFSLSKINNSDHNINENIQNCNKVKQMVRVEEYEIYISEIECSEYILNDKKKLRIFEALPLYELIVPQKTRW